METKVYSQDGKESGKVTLPETLFSAKWNPNLVHEVVVAMQSNARANTAHTKDRSEVAGTGKKPWRQKGTGRARHGSRRSPIWSGGGVTFGPRTDRNYSKKINKKARAQAFASVLAKKYAEGELIFVDSITLKEPKTAEAKTILEQVAKGSGNEALAGKRKNAALIVLPERNPEVEKSFRNFGNMEVAQAKDINPIDLLTYKYAIIADPAKSLKVWAARIGERSAKK